MKKAYSERSLLLQRESGGIVPLNTHGSSLYELNLRYSLFLASTTPVIFKRLHLKCNLIICQIATKTFPLQLGDVSGEEGRWVTWGETEGG